MTLVASGYNIPLSLMASAANAVSDLIDAADEVACFIMAVKAGNIVAVHWPTATVTTGGTLDVRLETVDTANGQPSGTLWGTTTNGAQVVVSTDDNVWFRTALTLAAAVNAGDIVAVVIANPTVSFANMNIKEGLAIYSGSLRLPYGANPLRSNLNIAPPAIHLEYDDGSLLAAPNVIPFARTGLALNTGTNPDEAALLFTPAFPGRVVGWEAVLTVAASADYRVALYASGNNTPLLTKSMDADVKAAATAGVYGAFFTGTQVLTVGTIYRLAIVPTTANSVTIQYFDGPTAASITNFFGNTVGYSARNRSGTSDPDSAAWSDTTTRVPAIVPIIDQLDNGTGAGGGVIIAGTPLLRGLAA